MDPIFLREIERILIVLTSALSIYLGYRLFLAIPRPEPGEGKVRLPGGVSIHITRVGPGVFFALFGAVVIALSLHESITYSREDTSTGEVVTYGGLSPQLATLQGAGGEPFGHELVAGEGVGGGADPLEVRLNMEFLNSLEALLKEDLPREELVRLERRRRDIKLALMSLVWPDDWGDRELFRLWAEGGSPEPVPAQLTAAVEYFRAGAGAVP